MDTDNQKLILQLKSTNIDTAINALKLVRMSGKPEYADILLDVFFETKYEDLKSQIILLFQEMRDVDFASIWAENLEKYLGREKFSDIVACGWMSPVDLSKNLMVFCRIIENGNFMDAVEALSVIEQNIHNLNPAENDDLEICLNNIFKSLTEDKKSLLASFIDPIE
ncbi:MAG: hypothetical protein GX879_11520 [Bacteroidales bacterium]|nr:hypothetical protein [Bacteroidales bacterium]